MNLLKNLGALIGIGVVSLILFPGCTSSTNSTSSGSGLVTRIQVIPAANSLQASQQTTTDPVTYIWSSTFITVIVRDPNGNPVPAGIPVTVSCGAGFLGEIPDPANPISSVTLTTGSNGQGQVKYTAGFIPGFASISAVSLGNYGSAPITIT
jgi:hypothetical protein